MITKLAILALALAACGGSQSAPKKPEPAPVTGIKKMPPPTCAATSDTMAVVILASNETPASDAEVKAVKGVLKTRCDADRWSDRAKECLATMQSEADADGCASMLTAEQRANIIKDERIRLGTGKPADPVAGTAKPGGDKKPSMAGVLAELEKHREKMCACKDLLCGDKVNREFMAWAQELEKKFGPDFKPDDADQEKLGKLVMEFGQCYSKLMAASEGAAPAPPPPPPPKKKSTTRGAQKKDPKKPAPKSTDPCMGGE